MAVGFNGNALREPGFRMARQPSRPPASPPYHPYGPCWRRRHARHRGLAALRVPTPNHEDTHVLPALMPNALLAALPAAATTPLAAALLPVLAYVAIQRTGELNLSLR